MRGDEREEEPLPDQVEISTERRDIVIDDVDHTPSRQASSDNIYEPRFCRASQEAKKEFDAP